MQIHHRKRKYTKKSTKNGADTIYMPIYTLDEMLAIGKYMRESPNFKQEYFKVDDKKMKSLYEEINGIFRHVFANKEDMIDLVRRKRINQLNNIDKIKLFKVPDIENPHTSHLLVCEVLKKADHPNRYNFFKCGYQFVNDGVRDSCLKEMSQLSVMEMIRILQFIDTYPGDVVIGSAKKLYGFLIARQLKEGVEWLKRGNNKAHSETAVEEIKLTFTCMRSELPDGYDMMWQMALYHPFLSHLPVGDLFFTIGNCFYIIEVGTKTSQKERIVTKTELEGCLAKFGLTLSDEVNLRFVYCPHPSMAREGKVMMDKDVNFTSCQIWYVPTNYGRFYP